MATTLNTRWESKNEQETSFVATSHFIGDYQTHPLLEAFSTPTHHVIVELDAVPIRSFTIHVKVISSSANPSRLHFGQSFDKTNEWRSTNDISFDQPDDSGLFSVTHKLPEPSPGLSFVVALSDGEWLHDHGGIDFHVGGATETPSVVEIPLPWPKALEVSHSLSLFRMNPFWLLPHWTINELGSRGETAHCLPTARDETFFVLARVEGEVPQFAALLLVIEPYTDLRASLFGGGVRLESGRCTSITATRVDGARIAVLALDPDPFKATRQAVSLAAEELGGFCTRLEKVQVPRWETLSETPRGLLSALGYCTWDAYGWNVRQEDIGNAIEWLREADIKLGYVIVDDGWQAGGSSGPKLKPKSERDMPTDRETLTSFGANEKFNGSLKAIAQKHDVNVLAWMSALGYWGGVSGKECGVETVLVKSVQPRGLFRNAADDPTQWANNVEMLLPEKQVVDDFYEKYFVRSLAENQGVFAAKIDGLGLIGTLCGPQHQTTPTTSGLTRQKLVKLYREAITRAAENAFPTGATINCMAGDPELLYNSGEKLTSANVCWRTSNDHAFPDFDETDDIVAWHIICNAMNTIVLGEFFPAPDWDMFRARDRNARVHAVARVLSGGPVYISDRPPSNQSEAAHSMRLLKSLTTHDGKLVRCKDVGRATTDCLFHDAREGPARLFKVSNSNSVSGVVGLFNLAVRVPNISEVAGSFTPSDVSTLEDDKEFISVVIDGEQNMQGYLHRSKTDNAGVIVPTMKVMVAHICPVFDVTPDIKVAAVGQPHLLNCSGAISSVDVEKHGSRAEVSIGLLDYGETYIWASTDSLSKLDQVTASDGSSLSYRTVSVSSLQLLSITVPDVSPFSVRLTFDV